MKRASAVFFFCLLSCVFFFACAQNTTSQKMPSPKERAKAKETVGVSMIQEGNLQGGLRELIQAGELDPSDASIQNSIGVAYRNAREYDKSVIHFQRALALKPDYPDARNNLGAVYASLGRWEQAVPLFEQAADNFKYKNRHAAHENLGTVYYYQGKYDLAIRHYNKALGLEPRYSPAYEKMGLAYERLKQWEKATAAYTRATRLNPKNPTPFLYLGRLYMNMKCYDKAENALKQAAEKDYTGAIAEESRRLLNELNKARDGRP